VKTCVVNFFKFNYFKVLWLVVSCFLFLPPSILFFVFHGKCQLQCPNPIWALNVLIIHVPCLWPSLSSHLRSTHPGRVHNTILNELRTMQNLRTETGPEFDLGWLNEVVVVAVGVMRRNFYFWLTHI